MSIMFYRIISFLVCDVTASCNGYLTKDGDQGYDVDSLLEDVKLGRELMCPECNAVLFTDKDEALEFLNT